MPNKPNILAMVDDVLRAAKSRRSGGLPRNWSAPREIRSGAIHEGSQNQYLIETNSARGSEKFLASKILSRGDPQSETWRAKPVVAMDEVQESLFRWGDEDSDDESSESVGDDILDIGERLPEDALLDRLSSSAGRELRALICDAETMHFTPEQRNRLLPILWEYIEDYRDSNDRDELVAVGAATRKYIAMMDLAGIEAIAVLLEPGNRAVLSLELVLEVAKMVYRKFEANPPREVGQHGGLATQLWRIAEAYLNPLVLPHDRHATIASLSIEAVVAMRSEHAESAIQAVVASPFAWFREMVMDDLVRLRERWMLRDADAATWCDDLIHRMG